MTLHYPHVSSIYYKIVRLPPVRRPRDWLLQLLSVAAAVAFFFSVVQGAAGPAPVAAKALGTKRKLSATTLRVG